MAADTFIQGPAGGSEGQDVRITDIAPGVTFTGGSPNPQIYNLAIPTADTEVSQALNPNTKSVLIRARGITSLKVAFVSGESGTNYLTIPAGNTFIQENINFTGIIYLQSTKSNQVIEILEWT